MPGQKLGWVTKRLHEPCPRLSHRPCSPRLRTQGSPVPAPQPSPSISEPGRGVKARPGDPDVWRCTNTTTHLPSRDPALFHPAHRAHPGPGAPEGMMTSKTCTGGRGSADEQDADTPTRSKVMRRRPSCMPGPEKWRRGCHAAGKG